MRRGSSSLAAATLILGMAMLLVGGYPAEAREDLLSGDLISYGQGQAMAGEIIVKFKPGVPPRAIDAMNRAHGTSVIHRSPFAGFLRLRLPPGRSVVEMVAAYRQNPQVAYAEPNFVRWALMFPEDPYYHLQWHLDDTVPPAGPNPYGGTNGGGINLEPAWDDSIGTGVVVAVIDTGIAYENYTERGGGPPRNYYQAPDLAQTSFVPGYDFVNNDDHPNDDNAHGTHVAGTVGQSTNNSYGVAGVAFGVSLMPVKVLDAGGWGTDAEIADGIWYAADNGAQVLNLSLGGPAPSTALELAVAHAYQIGATVVCAAGNYGAGPNFPLYPAAYDAYCIAVAATRYDETPSYYSNYGSYVDLAAPGGDLSADQNGDGYGDGVLQETFNPRTRNTGDFGGWFFQGTSMASPHVAGVAALVISAGASGPEAVREILESTAEDKGAAGWDEYYGWGIVDAGAAVEAALVPNTQPVADPNGPYTGTEDVAVTFDGSGSYDPDGDPLTYQWDFGDGNSGTGVSPSHAYAAGGSYIVTLVVNDGRADSDPVTTTADIAEVNDPPVADAGPDQTGYVGETLTFDASGSYDEEDGSTLSYDWDFGDGATGSGMIVEHAYAAAATYTVTLTVTDSASAVDTDTAVADITEAPTGPSMHVASIAMAFKTAGINTSALATVTVVDAGGNPVAGASVSGHWSGATGDSDVGLTDSSGQVTLESDKVKRAQSGTTFTLTVDDVALSGWTYDPAANVETSDSITVP